MPPPATSSPSAKVNLVLHVGMGKTGTSSIQFFLRDNRDRLAELGYLVPRTAGGARHGKVGLFAKPDDELINSPEWPRQKQSDPARFRRAFRRRFLAEIEAAGQPRVLLTDEILFGASEATLRRLARFTRRISQSLRLVVYLRRQDDHMVSRYQQGVKIGWTQRLDEWAREDMSSLYDYHSRLRRHEELLAPDTLVVRPYEPARFVAGSLFQDFLDAAGIEASVEELELVPNRNVSLDAESVEFLRLLNLYRVEVEGATPGLIDNRRLVSRLAEASVGPVLTMPEPFLDEFMSRWEESNRRVALDYLGDDTGSLFHGSRKTSNTTTRQWLDPARLGHFFTIAELPDEPRSALRQLAQQEANGR